MRIKIIDPEPSLIITPRGAGTTARGRVKIQVLDSRTKRVVQDRPWQKNLILNAGLDRVCGTNVWLACTAYCVAGTSILPTADESGEGTAAQSGTTVTATGFDFTAVTNQYNMIKWDSGEEAMITSVTDATHAEVNVSQTVSSGPFTVYRTNQTGLGAEVKRTATYLTGASNCYTQATAATGTTVNRRTYDFSAETGPVTYNEIGFSWDSNGGANLFSRILLADGVSLASEQQLRVIYDLTLVLTPITPNAKTADITGWPISPSATTDGFEQCESWGLSGVNSTTGATNSVSTVPDSGAGSYANEPSVGSVIVLSNCSTVLADFPDGNYVQGTTTSPTVGATLQPYSARDFYRIKRGNFAVSQANGTDLRSMALADSGYGRNMWSGFRFLFTEAQTKTALSTIQLNFKCSVGRVLG